MFKLLLFILIVAAIVYFLKKGKASNAIDLQKLSGENHEFADKIAEAKRHYKKGDNLWAEDFHAALAEYEMALLLDPDNKAYQFAVEHAKRNIKLDEEESG